MVKVMVVDDNALNRDLVVTLLGYKGHDLLQAADGAEALLAVRAERPDLVITDLLMPVLDGYELVREMRADPVLAATPVIFYTANYLHDEVAPIAAALGVHHIVSKPIDPQVLLRTVDEALAGGGTPAAVRPESFPRQHLRALSMKLMDKIDELDRAQAALRESEARFRSLAEFLPIGLFSISADVTVSYANRRLREICGLAGLSAADVDWSGLVHPEDRDRWSADVRRAIEQRRSHRDLIRLIRLDGDQRWVQVQLAPGLDQGDGVTYVGTVEDITEVIEAQRLRDEMETKLRSSERLESLGQLAAGVAHDFNNLLAVIVNYAHFVTTGIDEISSDFADARWAAMRQDSAAIHSAAERAAELTKQLLIFGRRDAARPEVVNVNAVVLDAVKLLGRTLGEHVLLEHDLDPSLAPVLSNRGQLEQVLVNLVVNARDAVGAGGHVAIRTDNVEVDGEGDLPAGAVPGKQVRVTVTDDGSGMAPETIRRAFEPFFKTKPTGHGTGLGLATVYGIVTQLGGSVSISSEVGSGTSVQVRLPAVARDQPRAERAGWEPDVSAASVAGAGQVILVAEDDDQVRAIAGRMLTENGYAVVCVERGDAALALIEDDTNRFDLLLSDVVMPEMSGRELAEHTAAERPDLPILFMSGYAAGLFAPGEPLPAGVDLLEKPFTQATLLAAVARAVQVG